MRGGRRQAIAAACFGAAVGCASGTDPGDGGGGEGLGDDATAGAAATEGDRDEGGPGAGGGDGGGQDDGPGADDGATGTATGEVPTTWYADEDGDGFGDPGDTVEACAAPPGYIDETVAVLVGV